MKKIYGNSYIINTLDRMIIKDKAAHAVIFYGESGLGKKLIADYYISRLLCNNTENGRPCGKCASCRSVENHSNPDVMYVKTEGKLEGYSVRTARDIISDIFIKPNNSSGRKIYVFRDCRNMSAQTQNMLLKIIEEPPEYAYFIFTAESKYEFLSTIISRCISFGLSPCTEQEAEESLSESGYNKKDIEKAVECFHGNIGRCIEYIEDEKTRKQIDLTKQIADSIIKGDEYGLNAVFYSVGSGRNELYTVFSMIDKLMRDTAVLYQDKNARIIGSFRQSAIILSEILSSYQANEIHIKIENAWKAIQANVNAQLVVASLCAEIMQIRS